MGGRTTSSPQCGALENKTCFKLCDITWCVETYCTLKNDQLGHGCDQRTYPNFVAVCFVYVINSILIELIIICNARIQLGHSIRV